MTGRQEYDIQRTIDKYMIKYTAVEAGFLCKELFSHAALIDLVTMPNLQILRANLHNPVTPLHKRVVAADLFIHFVEFLKLINPPEMKLKLNLKLKLTT
jgi:hypothetical protein